MHCVCPHCMLYAGSAWYKPACTVNHPKCRPGGVSSAGAFQARPWDKSERTTQNPKCRTARAWKLPQILIMARATWKACTYFSRCHGDTCSAEARKYARAMLDVFYTPWSWSILRDRLTRLVRRYLLPRQEKSIKMIGR
jgi:hypothetical protein